MSKLSDDERREIEQKVKDDEIIRKAETDVKSDPPHNSWFDTLTFNHALTDEEIREREVYNTARDAIKKK